MTRTTRLAALSLLSAVALSTAGLAHAETTVTRAQVLAEAAEAARTGDVLDYETGRKLNELFPGSYAAKSRQVANAAPAAPAKAAAAKVGNDQAGKQVASVNE